VEGVATLRIVASWSQRRTGLYRLLQLIFTPNAQWELTPIAMFATPATITKLADRGMDRQNWGTARLGRNRHYKSSMNKDMGANKSTLIGEASRNSSPSSIGWPSASLYKTQRLGSERSADVQARP
jgi:hypothetical protein